MIAVIADDFTGAAELAGIGYRFGLAVEVQTSVVPETTAELLVIDTDSRSIPQDIAVGRVKAIMHELIGMPIDWIFKKTDSVLRGHVLAELTAVADALNVQSTLLVPANPGVGKTIRNGEYFIDDRPLHQTHFANDPGYPATTSEVKRLLGGLPESIGIARPGTGLPPKPLVVGEASSPRDVQRWAQCLLERMLPAGGAEFFGALLQTRGHKAQPSGAFSYGQARRPLLFISGSASQQSRQFLQVVSNLGLPVCLLPCSVRAVDRACLRRWLTDIQRALSQSNIVIAAIGQLVSGKAAVSQALPAFVAEMVKRVLERRPIEDLIIEGGATASRIIRTLGWRRFRVTEEILPGVVRMQVMNQSTSLTVKPGSYPLPAELLAN